MPTETRTGQSGEGHLSSAQTRPPEQWTHEECVDYEVARECIGGLIAIRSKWIYNEEKKLSPDLEAIARWDAEIDTYVQERRGLDLHDHENIARIRRDYGAEIRRLHAEETQRLNAVAAI